MLNPNNVNTSYIVRDSLLNKSRKAMQYIDDYYYGSYVLNSETITFSTALKVWTIYNSSFYDKLAYINDVSYGDSILITNADKIKLLNLVSDVRSINNSDSRFVNILNKIESDINSYTNKTVTYIKNQLLDD